MKQRKKDIVRSAVRRFTIGGLVVLLCQTASAQDIITPMLEQIAKLELYLKDAQKGYAIVQQGLTTIGQIKKGQFDLHSVFFGSLMTVNPAIKEYGKVADIVSMQVKIIAGCKQTLSQFTGAGVFTAGELKYFSTVYDNLLDVTVKDIDELTSIVSDGDWQMTDDERLARIDQLYLRVTEKYSFFRSFSNQVSVRGNQRQRDAGGLSLLQNLFGQ